jgi:hypothetical protein
LLRDYLCELRARWDRINILQNTAFAECSGQVVKNSTSSIGRIGPPVRDEDFGHGRSAVIPRLVSLRQALYPIVLPRRAKSASSQFINSLVALEYDVQL